MPAKGKKAGAAKKTANGYKKPPPIPTGEVIYDPVFKRKWRIGPSIGVGGFGEIYSACDDDGAPVIPKNYPYVIKIEPHENGPLFVEKHFYIRNTNKNDIENFLKSRKLSSFGMPQYYGSGSHIYKGEQFRFLVLERYGKDIWSIFKEVGRTFPAPVVFQLGLQMLDVLEYIHGRGYVHADLKGANIMLGRDSDQQAFLLDYGLATRVNDKEFRPDPKCAHNGTLEYTSRDAHLGVATMRGDVEILAYNMLQWMRGALPWEPHRDPNAVHLMKIDFMDHVRQRLTQHHDVPGELIQLFEYINSLKPKDQPDYAKCRNIFETYLSSQGKTRSSKLVFTTKKTKTTSSKNNEADKDQPKPKRGRRPKQAKPNDSDNENEVPEKKSKQKRLIESDDENEVPEKKGRQKKRKSSEPAVLVNMKKTKIAPKATPPAKTNHANIATQTSAERRRSPRQVSFESPVCHVIGDQQNGDLDSSRDIFDESFTLEKKSKPKPKRKLLAKQEVTVKRVVRKKVTTVAKRGSPGKVAVQ